MSVSAAKSRVMQAKMQIESGRTDEAEATLAAADKFLEDVPDPEKVAVVAELAALRTQLANTMKPEHVRALSAATGKVKQARAALDDGNTYGLEDTLRAAEGFLTGVAPAHTAELKAQITAMRQEVIHGKRPAGAPPSTSPGPMTMRLGAERGPVPEATAVAPPPASSVLVANVPVAAPLAPAMPAAPPPVATAAAPAPAAPRALTDDEAANLSRGKSRIMQARSLLESGDTANVTYTLDTADGFLSQVPAFATTALVAEIAELRARGGGAANAADAARIEDELRRGLGHAHDNMENRPEAARESISRVSHRLDDDEVKRALSAAMLDKWHAAVVAHERDLADTIKAVGLRRARPIMMELEEAVAKDPFAGLDQRGANLATAALERLRQRVRVALHDIPENDPDVQAISARLAVVERAIDRASAAWGKALLDARVDGSWAQIQADIAGWEHESLPLDARPLADPRLPKTRAAVMLIRALLEDPETIRIREAHRGDPTIEATYRAAEDTCAAAATHLHAAFTQVLDDAERMPTPVSRFDLDRPNLLAVSAEYALAGTVFRDQVIARARALDDRWKAEVATNQKSRQALSDRLVGAADTAWPVIVASIGKTSDLEPGDPAAVGKTIVLRGVYNRLGWNYNDYDFAMNLDGTRLGGTYEPWVRAAVEYATAEQRVEVSDRIAWDVVAIVDGPGTIREHTVITLRSTSTNLEIGKVEEWRPVDCVKLRIIALHAGPVAVGPP